MPSPSFSLNLPERQSVPRTQGLTNLIDPGLPTRYFEDVIQSHGHLVDCVKFGWGTSLVTKDLKSKIEVLRAHGVRFCFGGSLFEKAVQQRKVDDYRRWCMELRCDVVEVSDGTVEISPDEKARHISDFSRDFVVYSEVGYKDADKSIKLPPSKWVEFIQADLASGATYVITESRESGTSGICRPSGELRFGLIEDILASRIDPAQLIFEAPNKGLQAFFIGRLGPGVNLGNVAFADVVGLETLRLGLRAETLMLF